jgi:hypothetical protein
MAGNNWYVASSPSMGMPGGTTVGGGGDTSVITPRDPLDAARMANGFAPGASYPDGYLGTITDRRQDKLFGALQTRLTDRSYQRGVHLGDKIGRDHYFWTADCNPDAGIARQATARPVDNDGGIVFMSPRYAPQGDPVENLTAMGNSASLPPEQQMQVARQYGVDPALNPLPMSMTNPGQFARMQHMLPSYAK